jgi:hypothetical protein
MNQKRGETISDHEIAENHLMSSCMIPLSVAGDQAIVRDLRIALDLHPRASLN